MAVDRRRRKVLGGLLAGLVAGWLGRVPSLAGPRGRDRRDRERRDGRRGGAAGSGKTAGLPDVVVARRDALRKAGAAPDPAVVREMLGAAIARATGAADPVAGLRSLLKPGDVVGLKLNCLAGRGLSPRPELVAALVGWLLEAGVAPRRIVLFDRSTRELRRAGFTPASVPGGVRVVGIDNDYDWTPREWGPSGSCFARVLVREVSALINVGVVKDHDLAGVSLGLKNWYGVIHNPNKMHDDGCFPYVAHLAAYPLIRDRLRLTVLDGIVAQAHGGPARAPKWSWPWGGVIVSAADPVAVDAIGLRVIEDRRREIGLPSLAAEKRAPRWLPEAERLGLGKADPGRIRVVET